MLFSHIVSQAPTRICLIGGGTDVNPYAAQHQGAIINVAINMYHRVTLTPRADKRILVEALHEVREFELNKHLICGEDPRFDLVRAIINYFSHNLSSGFDLSIESDAPDGCGIGTSGSVGVAIIGAIKSCLGLPVKRDEIARLAFEIETTQLGWAGGKQDQWAAAYGGLNLTLYGPGEKVQVQPLNCSEELLQLLHDWLLLIHVGGQRLSAKLQVALQKGMQENDRHDALNKLKELTHMAKTALEQGDFEQLGALFHQGWEAKKKSNPIATNERINSIYEAGKENGALGGKIIGAGGAGYLFFFCPTEMQPKVIRAVEQHKANKVDFEFDMQGLKVRVDK
ncbi:MAG: hypothetical protein V1754_07055 [Pseudomonadota bacterium]